MGLLFRSSSLTTIMPVPWTNTSRMFLTKQIIRPFSRDLMTCYHTYQLATKSALALPVRRVQRRKLRLSESRLMLVLSLPGVSSFDFSQWVFSSLDVKIDRLLLIVKFDFYLILYRYFWN